MLGSLRALAVAILLLSLAGQTFAGSIPPRPEQLTFPELQFVIPDAQSMRFELGNGTPVYALQSRELPLIRLSVLFRGGGYLDPKGKEGLATLTSEVWRSGGAGSRSAQQLDEELDLLAAILTTRVSDVAGAVSLDVMSKDFERALAILIDLLTAPRFQEDRFERAKADLIQDMRSRNDDIVRIEEREFNRLIYGDDYWINRLPTKATVEALTPADSAQLVRSLIGAGNIIVAISGDFELDSMRTLLDRGIGALPPIGKPIPDVPQPQHKAEPGVYLINKEDVNQGRVRLGHLGYAFAHPDALALTIVNEVLGGGGFTARMMKELRSDKALTYGAYSTLNLPDGYPGTFSAWCQTKSSTCAYAASETVDLIRQITTDEVTPEELSTAATSFVETFPRYFESPAQTVALFATSELMKRPPGFWLTYRDRVRAVTADRALAAARRDIHPEGLVILIVGNIEEISKGHPDHPVTLSDLGPITRIPLRDPLTLEEPAE